MKTSNSLYHGHRFPGAVISCAVRWYFRFQLSLRDIEELLFECGVIVTHAPKVRRRRNRPWRHRNMRRHSGLDHHRFLADEVKRRFGGVDVYMANAAVINITPSAKVTVAEFDEHFATNTRGVFFGVQGIAPVMRDGGSIIVVVGSLATTKVLDNHAVYAGSKAVITAFARNWALELKSRKIRVNVLSPGPTETAILTKLGIPETDRPPFLQAMSNMIPSGRMGRPEELASAALFLASDASSFVNGTELHADGGMALV
jgi:NAD(P)-dependent dehydrogenase (short-subunit alcohol dehydrogenase family)